MGRLVGIDLGTTNSCVAVMEGDAPRIIHTRQGDRTMPSVVAFREDGQRLVGAPARRQAVANPKATVFGAKRLIGRKLNDPQLQDWKSAVPYQLVPAANGDAWVRVNGRDYSPQELSAFILEELKATAEDYLGEEVTGAVITVPAYFNDGQRQATRDAGAIAGLDVKKIVNEPTAAALGYGVDKKKDQVFAVFDLGGGTFDVTILRVTGGVFEILSTNGDTFLGGDDVDHGLIQHLVRRFNATTGVDLTESPQAMQRLREAAEQAKRELSSALNTAIHLPYIASGPKGPVHLELESLDRRTLVELSADLLGRLELPCRRALEDAKLTADNLERIVLVGGMSRMPAVQKKVEQILGKPPSKDVNPDEIVALGAAGQCAIMCGVLDEVVLLDITPHSLGVRVRDDRMSVLIPRNSTVPTSKTRIYRTTTDDQQWVDIEVYQGEAGVVVDNTHVGRFRLGDLPRGPAGHVHIEVTFLIDVDGVISATAREMRTGRETSVRLTAASGLTDAQFERAAMEHRAKVG